MATDINTVAVAGRLVRDADLKYTNSGTAICEFSIANNYSIKRGDQWEEAVNYFDCTLFGRRAEALHKHLAKGKQVAVSGELQQQRWETDGQKRSRVKIMVRNLQLLGGSRDGGDSGTGGSYDANTTGGSSTDFEDDVPF